MATGRGGEEAESEGRVGGEKEETRNGEGSRVGKVREGAKGSSAETAS